jgi:hypothetical protein
MTGTGSGKTECFLLPILGKLAVGAKNKPDAFKHHSALRAIILYPMNALVNDQLGRLRLLFGDQRIVDKFMSWAGRPARFARYTSRTLYPGVRKAKKDQTRLKPIGDYYVNNLLLARGEIDGDQEAAAKLVSELKKRGKWPAKPDLVKWYGRRSERWQDRSGAFKRCVTLPHDPELLTRHEVQDAPPDVLVTNYSMLEYMLMRPLERPIFDRTGKWLEENPDERLLLVVDEAHLYRGASGAEVALLIRRLRARLGIPPERLQVICTSASFQEPDYAPKFAARLTGKQADDFEPVQGDLRLSEDAAVGTNDDAQALTQVDLEKFYKAETDEQRLEAIAPFLDYRKVRERKNAETALHEALLNFPPMQLLVNVTMKQACSVDAIGNDIFPEVEQGLAARAVTTLMALGSLARRNPAEPGLLPCRIHSFYRGLPGLWVCMDSECSGLDEGERGGPAGKLYGQPREACDHCGARVLELYTCRNCGAAYARAYTDNLDQPEFLWPEAGTRFSTSLGEVGELRPIDLLLEAPASSAEAEPADYDLMTGRLNGIELGSRIRQVFIKRDRSGRKSNNQGDEAKEDPYPGEFKPCGVCLGSASFGRTSVQDHQTKGDQPFQALITKQIQVQPPGTDKATQFAPLRGRKVLIFSDSRQTAARLAPNVQMYSTRDVLRPLIIRGFQRLQDIESLRQLLSLDSLYLAVLVAANELEVRIRPELKSGESLRLAGEVEKAISSGVFGNLAKLLPFFINAIKDKPPEALLAAIVATLNDQYYGLESLALASIVEAPSKADEILSALPSIPGLAVADDEKLALIRAWLRCWRSRGFWLDAMPTGW